jgi:hypothetical protein
MGEVMPFYKIDVDDEVWQFLKKHAEPFQDTPNTVLRRILLGTNGEGPGSLIRTERTMHLITLEGKLPDFPHGVPQALAQILEVIYGVHKIGLSRMQATNIAAQKRHTAPQTIIDKYCRQLGKRAHEVDQLLLAGNLHEFQTLLEKRFVKHRDLIKDFFNSLNNPPRAGS